MDLKNSVFLPKTDFPMKASLATREPEILSRWGASNLYSEIRETSKGRPKFILHFGPPYANGDIHMGHALTEVLKDIVNKSYQMRGYDAPMVPGWDCHGLPIEWSVEKNYQKAGKNKDEVPILEFRQACRDYALKWIEIQKVAFQRLGIIADWENPYITMDFKAEAAIVRQLGNFLLNGTLYRGLRPVMWSVIEKTALADMEVEYKDHTSDAIYVKYPIVKSQDPDLLAASVLIWTTTPWSLPGSRAISYGPDISYVLVKEEEERFLVAQELLENLKSSTGHSHLIFIKKVPQEMLKGVICAHPMAQSGYGMEIPLIDGAHVTTEVGTGFVHTAPSHGVEDFEVCKAHGIDVPETLGPDGLFYPHIPVVAGQHVYKVNPLIIETLQKENTLFHSDKIVHSYPHSWRSKAPLIYRATAQWFISMEKDNLREKALKAIEEVSWYPSQSKNRIRSMVEGRPDWCLSRQRAWGTPLTVFVHKVTGEVLRDKTVHERIVAAVEKEGGDVWFTSPAERFLGEDYPASEYEKVTDVIDVWFDSGCTHEFVLRDRPDQQWPADLYLEGSDQHRGWFQSSLLESCGVHGKAPYKKVLTHGFTLTQQGYKMSKSQGNGVDPAEITQKWGADILRLWVASVDYSEDMRIGPEILKQQEDVYRRLRNTLRYLLGALNGYDAGQEHVLLDQMPPLEKWVLARLYQIQQQYDEALETLNFTAFYSTLHNFCSLDLSAFYFDVRKDCLYCDSALSLKRRATRTVMNYLFEHLIHWLAPVLSFTAEEAFLCRHGEEAGSIHAKTQPLVPENWKNDELLTQWERIRLLRRVMTGALEIERANKTLGSSLQGAITVYVSPSFAEDLKIMDTAELAITSQAHIVVGEVPENAYQLPEIKEVGVIVSPADGEKCQRCWRVLPEVATHAQHICNRCEEAI